MSERDKIRTSIEKTRGVAVGLITRGKTFDPELIAVLPYEERLDLAQLRALGDDLLMLRVDILDTGIQSFMALAGPAVLAELVHLSPSGVIETTGEFVFCLERADEEGSIPASLDSVATSILQFDQDITAVAAAGGRARNLRSGDGS